MFYDFHAAYPSNELLKQSSNKLLNKYTYIAKYSQYDWHMTETMHETIAINVEKLKNKFAMSQKDIAKKSDLSQRTVSNALNPGSVDSLTAETIEKLAACFGLEPYHLLIPGLPIEELLSKRLQKVIECYAQADSDGRENIARISENEMRYRVIQKYGH